MEMYSNAIIWTVKNGMLAQDVSFFEMNSISTPFVVLYFIWWRFKGIHAARFIFYFLLQVWCVESEEQQYQNWTVNSSQKKLDISALKPGKQYWITIAAVNGAGVGTPSDPHGFLISELHNKSSIIAVMSPQQRRDFQ